MNLDVKIEAILFWKNEPMSRRRLGEILKVSPGELDQALNDLKEKLRERGIVLVEKEGEVALGTNSSLSDLLENLQKEELNKDLSKASLETLSIILYKNGATRSEIDYIRGVNSNFILRALSVRGLVEKAQDPKDQRRYIYKPTFNLLSYMGLSDIRDLPEYESNFQSINSTIEALKESEVEAGDSSGNN
jgi:segregation and condensation protein B